MKISPSNLMILNRAVAHDNMPTDKAWFRTDDDRVVPYQKRKPGILSAKETLRDIENVTVSLLNQLPDNEAKLMRAKHREETAPRKRYIRILVELINTHGNMDDVRKYAPNLFKL